MPSALRKTPYRADVDWPRPSRYRGRILDSAVSLLESGTSASTLLDFGGGDGWFGANLRRLGLVQMAVCTEVKIRAAGVKPVLFDGKKLPFPDRAFELSAAVDVLHHCPNPLEALHEVLRCTAKQFLLKDHTCAGRLDRALLIALDEIGNRRFGVASPGHYQERWGWEPSLRAAGFERVAHIYPMECHGGPLGRCTNHLQFMSLWRRIGPDEAQPAR